MCCLCVVHFCTYKEKFISLYCRLSSVLDLDALITQQALREAITDIEVATAKQRHQLILDYIQVRNTQVKADDRQLLTGGNKSLFLYFTSYPVSCVFLRKIT